MPRKKADADAERKPRTAGRTYRITGMEEVRALSHPLRLRLLELFAQCPRTTKQAAEELGEAPTRLYHHVAALEKAGLVRETRRKRGTTEKYFEAVTNRFLAGSREALREKGTKRDHEAVGLVVFDQARNELVRALAADTDTDKTPPTLVAVRSVLRLSPRAAKQLAKRLQDLLASLHSAPKSPGSPKSRAVLLRYALTVALIPTDQGGE